MAWNFSSSGGLGFARRNALERLGEIVDAVGAWCVRLRSIVSAGLPSSADIPPQVPAKYEPRIAHDPRVHVCSYSVEVDPMRSTNWHHPSSIRNIILAADVQSTLTQLALQYPFPRNLFRCWQPAGVAWWRQDQPQRPRYSVNRATLQPVSVASETLQSCSPLHNPAGHTAAHIHDTDRYTHATSELRLFW